MIKFTRVSLQRGARLLIKDISFALHAHQKMGLIGENGCGKSSLMAVILRRLAESSGDVHVPAHLKIAHLAQEIPNTDKAAVEYVIDGDAELRLLEAELDKHHEDGEHIAALHAEFATIDGYTAKSRAASLLDGLGFEAQDIEKPVNTFSGGWRMRLNLARALMCRSDLLLLDEPTNHLDLEAIFWLEEWLKQYRGMLLLISHDRDFLDNVVTHIAHVERQQLKVYTGHYTDFERQRTEALALQQNLFEKQQRQRAHLEQFIARFRAKATKATQAQSRIKALERLTQVDAAHVDSPFTFEFSPALSYPSPLLRLENVTVAYGKTVMLRDISLSVEPGTRLGLLGKNGAGKSTLIKTLAGELSPQTGTLEVHPGAKIGYFAQHQLEQLNPQESPLAHLQALDKRVTEKELRSFLGRFGFIGDAALAKVAPFSGGEKARLVLALIVFQKPNVLLLDEPTNHLDLEMRHALACALQNYEGALIVVSHDRQLLRTTTNAFLLVEDQALHAFPGDLEDYQTKMAKDRRANTASNKQKTAAAKKAASMSANQAALKKQIATFENEMHTLQNKLNTVQKQLEDPKLYDDAASSATIAQYLQQQTALKQQLEQKELAWLQALDTLEQASHTE